ncbi:MAG: hydroxyacid dehydrogenase [Alphaproteobacteria bacterium]|jgi:D-3-phosphoglycerate dehydrogenase|nr:3-phosphoglycerate dehydrogenase [Rhodospirillaceae bacterium]MDP6023570.1 hydroxyacid dehydrogenase [Alphaproteobacteria bacterium]MDP6253230.1 hydroxyacid dehydrogenase [Alphaproteobacteria bacterium]MDP7055972.1 hydroxyacid dehydrogenase [Alphaproteobacteria bacterium]MDP7230067.1 hydroxyacid dehydrogenase [Alphaproteobacteria bacterium]|tara:strand:- start:1523 stop:2575 length:1053 start_codon:yes stop_codon:yes gene_type:complete
MSEVENNSEKRLVYFEKFAHPVTVDVLARDPSITVQRLELSSSDAENWQALSGAHGYQIRATRDELPDQFFAHGEFLQRCPNMLVVSSMGSGTDTIDLADCTKAGVLVVNQAGGNAEAVAEHALALMLSLSKRVGETDQFMRAQDGIDRTSFMGHNIQGKTLGIIGLGHVGRRVAELCGTLFSMRVLAYDPYLEDSVFEARGAIKSSWGDLLSAADFITVHCPRTAETEDFLNADSFALMKPGAIFINTARGGIHDEAALFAALDSGHLAAAGLDVWAVEPPAADHPLLRLSNVLASPHTAGVTYESRHKMGTYAGEQLLEIFAGRRPPRLLNPEVWPVFEDRFKALFGG